MEPIAPHPRLTWEYQFVIEGRQSVIVQEERETRHASLVGPVACVAGPECVHGWGGDPEDVCHVLVFHFDEMDYSIRSIIGNKGLRIVPFSTAEIPLLYSLYDRCSAVRRAWGTSQAKEKQRAGYLEPLTYAIVAAELALVILRHLPREELGPAPNFGESKIAEALAWYEANLVRNPSIDDVARAVHVSGTHLRRLFHKIRGTSPQKAFTDIQLKRVKWLMRDRSMALERIAESAGYGSASAFSRAFSKEFGVPPNVYRKKMVLSPDVAAAEAERERERR